MPAVDLTDCARGDHTHLLAFYFSLCDLPLLFVYFQVNTGVLYFLNYVGDIYDGGP